MKSQYIFTNTQFDSELKRLQILEQVSDPASRRRILATGLTTGWQCLEVGAGAGSIMRWMSQEIGISGKVTAVDVNTRFVENTFLPNVAVIELHGAFIWRLWEFGGKNLIAVSTDKYNCFSKKLPRVKN